MREFISGLVYENPWKIFRQFSGGLGSVRLTVGLDLKGLFQPK